MLAWLATALAPWVVRKLRSAYSTALRAATSQPRQTNRSSPMRHAARVWRHARGHACGHARGHMRPACRPMFGAHAAPRYVAHLGAHGYTMDPGGDLGDTLGLRARQRHDAGDRVLADAEGGRRPVVGRWGGLLGPPTLADDVPLVANTDPRRQAGALEGIIGFLEVQPERQPWAFRVRRQVGLGHAEGEHMHGNAVLPLAQGPLAQGIDLIHHRIGHGKAADRAAATVHENVRAGAGERAIEGVGIANVEGVRAAAPGIELLQADTVEPLGCLLVPLAHLGPKAARPEAYVIGIEVLEAALPLNPQLELGLLLEDADHHGTACREALLGEPPLAVGGRERDRWRLLRGRSTRQRDGLGRHHTQVGSHGSGGLGRDTREGRQTK